MTKYKVLKPMPRAKVGDELEYDEINLCLYDKATDKIVVSIGVIEDALSEGFIEEIKEEKRWRAEQYEPFWVVTQLALTSSTREQLWPYDDDQYQLGNYFKSKETAKLVAEAQKLMYEYLHTEPGTPQQNIKNQFEQAHAQARKAVLADDRIAS